MTQTAKVHSLTDDGRARVLVIRESACSGDCHKCSGCGAAQESLLFEAENPIGAQPGDKVEITSDSRPVLTGAAMLYMLPLLLFFAGYAFGALCFARGALGGGIGFVAGIALAAWYDRKIAAKKKPIYTITGFADTAVPQICQEGDYDVD